MKIFLVSTVLALGLLTMIIFMDMLMGVDPSKLIWKAINPFRVIETAEVVIIFIFIGMFLTQTIFNFVKKKKRKASKNQG